MSDEKKIISTLIKREQIKNTRKKESEYEKC